MAGHSQYRGPERRRHRAFLTQNTEYHFRDDCCVAVRDRKTGSWLPSHMALLRRLTGGVRVLRNGTPVPVVDTPSVGEALYFGDDEGRELVTSKLCGVDRPGRLVTQTYPQG
jgi:hypothetical protein